MDKRWIDYLKEPKQKLPEYVFLFADGSFRWKELVRCKDCKYQRKIWHSDKRRKDGGYTIYICDACEYAPLGYDTDYCSYGERRDDERID